jgi:hypothetical protein
MAARRAERRQQALVVYQPYLREALEVGIGAALCG